MNPIQSNSVEVNCSPHCAWIIKILSQVHTFHIDSILRFDDQDRCGCRSRWVPAVMNGHVATWTAMSGAVSAATCRATARPVSSCSSAGDIRKLARVSSDGRAARPNCCNHEAIPAAAHAALRARGREGGPKMLAGRKQRILFIEAVEQA